jgi:small subunit ribosomal protein S5
MEPEKINEEIKIEEVTAVVPQTEAPLQHAGREFRKNSRKPAPRREARVKPEFDQKIIDIRRVTRVVTGGRRFSFSVAVVIGDRKGRVGVGMGKAGDTPVAIDKAVRNARKNMIKVNLTKHSSPLHDVSSKFSSSRVLIMRAPGKGILAGSSVRVVLELAGIKEVSAKIFSRSKNKINNAKAAISALSKMKAPKINK